VPAPPGHIRTTLSLPPPDRERLDQLALLDRRTLSEQVAWLVEQEAARRQLQEPIG
jgi:hypothetical protein